MNEKTPRVDISRIKTPSNNPGYPSHSSNDYFSKPQLAHKNNLKFMSLSDARYKKQIKNKGKPIQIETDLSHNFSSDGNSRKNFTI